MQDQMVWSKVRAYIMIELLLNILWHNFTARFILLFSWALPCLTENNCYNVHMTTDWETRVKDLEIQVSIPWLKSNGLPLCCTLAETRKKRCELGSTRLINVICSKADPARPVYPQIAPICDAESQGIKQLPMTLEVGFQRTLSALPRTRPLENKTALEVEDRPQAKSPFTLPIFWSNHHYAGEVWGQWHHRQN